MTGDEKAMLRDDATMDQAVEHLKALATTAPEAWSTLGKVLEDALAQINRHPLPPALNMDQSEFEGLAIVTLAYYAHQRVSRLLLGRSV